MLVGSVRASVCVAEVDGRHWLAEATNRSLLTEYRFSRTEPSNEKRFRFAKSNREYALEAKTCRETGHGGEAAAPRKG